MGEGEGEGEGEETLLPCHLGIISILCFAIAFVNSTVQVLFLELYCI